MGIPMGPMGRSDGIPMGWESLIDFSTWNGSGNESAGMGGNGNFIFFMKFPNRQIRVTYTSVLIESLCTPRWLLMFVCLQCCGYSVILSVFFTVHYT